MKLILLVYTFLGFGICTFAQDTSFLKIAYAGTSLKVHEGKTWTIDRVFISEGGQYAIQARTNHFLPLYQSNEAIQIPFYIPEMELLTNKDFTQFQIYISETVNN
jgi:hypothetical protein